MKNSFIGLIIGIVISMLLVTPLYSQFTISTPVLNQTNSTTVTISWTTSVPASGYVFLAEDDNSQGLPIEVEDPSPLKTSHIVYVTVNNGHTYYYMIDQNDASFNNVRSPEYSFVAGSITSVDNSVSQPAYFQLHQNYPNPFNPTTTIEFTLAEDGMTTLKVYDILGRELTILVNEELKAGVLHQTTFDASQLSSGLYFYRLESGNKTFVKKFMLMK